ncbi:enoyl-CoA hydratase/isomerase family protein [Aminipila butyrica]|uniref:Enoyl-CoA hydratase/isomerase family protein n=1 Tax=Aminipila butyrica TaxID=433296 RepID=A0A858BV62_9FIRM|nr:enoyl-CoA hydratase/isomerase family protein [Aminipila butyrica]QIB69079.1 enoyl-CoA hydratase/isomerase family protein [Aminipila butyrica]
MSIQYDVQHGVALITINRPEKLNALTLQMYEELANAFKEAGNSPEVSVCILTGAGEKAFCVGADLTESIPHLAAGHYISEWDDAHLKHTPMYKPIIAAVNGFCMGGGFEILFSTDIRLASEEALFSLPEVGLGVVPAGGTLVRLARQIPYAKAMELILTGKSITAQEALEYGILNYVVKPKELLSQAFKLAERITERSPVAVQGAKEAVIKLLSLPMDQAFDTEALLGYKVFMNPDAKEGLDAFYNKRKPDFPSRRR